LIARAPVLDRGCGILLGHGGQLLAAMEAASLA
jgi:hypothetical protein